MPEITDSLFVPAGQRVRRSGEMWDTWLDGRVWSFYAGSDFQTSPHSFRRLVKQVAKYRNLDVTIQVKGNEVRIQAHRGD